MKIAEITSFIESHAPLMLQESYDNAGLIVGDRNEEVTKVLLCIDVTEKVVEEAILRSCNLLIAHHPLIFGGIDKINPENAVGKCIIQAIRNNIAIYACHTNLDNIKTGVNAAICEKLGLKNCQVLRPKKNLLKKLVTFCPLKQADKVRNAIFEAGAGHIGNYDSCSYNAEGYGTFRGLENTNPFVGNVSEFHKEPEERIETIFPVYKQQKILEALVASHPYEEVAYDVYPLDNTFSNAGEGMLGALEKPVPLYSFFDMIKQRFQIPIIRHNASVQRKIKKVAVCGGSGGFLIPAAVGSGADLFITADIKYHQFCESRNSMVIADIGHYESEQFTKELLYRLLIEKFPTFAVLISKINSNPVRYF